MNDKSWLCAVTLGSTDEVCELRAGHGGFHRFPRERAQLDGAELEKPAPAPGEAPFAQGTGAEANISSEGFDRRKIMKVWAKTEKFSEGKFLVVRRDGTVPSWPHFVIGARDPSAPAALRAYAASCQERADRRGDKAATARMAESERLHNEAVSLTEYGESVLSLADDFEKYRDEYGKGDPDSPPHRVDCQPVIDVMRAARDGRAAQFNIFVRTTQRRKQVVLSAERIRELRTQGRSPSLVGGVVLRSDLDEVLDALETALEQLAKAEANG